MNVDKLSRLFGANASSYAEAATKQPTNVSTEQPTAQNREAVTLAPGFGSGDSDRSARVASLKGAYEAGTLSYDSEKVATAVYRDLLI